jgi:hypothetical protein
VGGVVTVTLLAITMAVPAIIALAFRWRTALATSDRIDRLGALVLAPGIFTLSLLIVTVVIGMLRSDWNAARLTPTFALVYGYRLYYPATDGPILNTIYGPVSALAYLPATVFRTPTAAILAAGALEVLFVFLPMLAFVHRAGRCAGASRPVALACGIAACLLMARYQGSAYWIGFVEADGPALALGLVACMALLSQDTTPPAGRRLALSAGAVVLACWAKQIDAPLALGLLLAVWLAHGRGVARAYALALAGIGAATSLLFLGWFGEPMIFDMVTLVVHQPWYQPGLAGLAAQVWRLLGNVWELVIVVAVALPAALLLDYGGAPVAARPWVPPLLAALFLLPGGALGANKLGGDQNSFHSVYFLLAAVAALLVERGQAARVGRVLGYAFCAAAIVAAWRSDRIPLWKPQPPLWQNDPQLAYDFAVRHPGEAYFPWQPLSSLLAEARLYHFDYAMIDRVIGGYAPTPEHVRRYLPPRMRWIAARGRVYTFGYFPEYSEEVRLPELPGWLVHTRPSP